MALGATVLKAELTVSDLDRSHFADYSLVVAQHPSENAERVMTRVLAFALNACEDLQFGKGLSNEDEAAVWEIDPTGRIVHWIEVGQPDETRLKKACSRADRVSVYTFGRSAPLWLDKNRAALEKLEKVKLFLINDEDTKTLASVHAKSMKLNWTIQEGEVYLDDRSIRVQTLGAA